MSLCRPSGVPPASVQPTETAILIRPKRGTFHRVVSDEYLFSLVCLKDIVTRFDPSEMRARAKGEDIVVYVEYPKERFLVRCKLRSGDPVLVMSDLPKEQVGELFSKHALCRDHLILHGRVPVSVVGAVPFLVDEAHQGPRAAKSAWPPKTCPRAVPQPYNLAAARPAADPPA